MINPQLDDDDLLPQKRTVKTLFFWHSLGWKRASAAPTEQKRKKEQFSILSTRPLTKVCNFLCLSGDYMIYDVVSHLVQTPVPTAPNSHLSLLYFIFVLFLHFAHVQCWKHCRASRLFSPSLQTHSHIMLLTFNSVLFHQQRIQSTH